MNCQNSKSKKTTTETSYKDGKKITKQIIEETIIGSDGKERTTRREIISTEAESEQEAKKKNEGVSCIINYYHIF